MARLSSAARDDEPDRVVRPIGRPRREISSDAVADAVAQLFDEGGFDSVSIEAAAQKLSMSRATLYRTVPTKNHLLGILFERSTSALRDAALAVLERETNPRDQLDDLIRIHVDAAIRMQGYMSVFFGGAGLPDDVYHRWHGFSHEYEQIWLQVVTRAMAAGELDGDDPVIVMRLLLGMCIWVSRWYKPSEKHASAEIADAAVHLVGGRLPRLALGEGQRAAASMKETSARSNSSGASIIG